MRRTSGKLSARRVETLTKPGRYADGYNLYLQVAEGGTKSWLFRYQLNGRARAFGLGPLHVVSLQAARERAREAQRLLLDGIDPIDHKHAGRNQRRLEAARRVTFRQAAAQYMASHESAWRNAVHRAQWRTSLEQYVYPLIGSMSVADIDLPLILKILEPCWETKRTTMSRVRGRVETVLDWATVRGLRQGDNPAAWRGRLEHLLSANSKQQSHHAALPWREVPAFMATLRERDRVAARALEFLILTATRVGESLGAVWPEIDLDAQTWTIPSARMKAGREHRVPLAARAVDLLRSLPRKEDDQRVFAGSRLALARLIKNLGTATTLHGFRSSFRDWAAERTAYPREVAEAALAHRISDAVERSYLRGSFWEKRVRLMDEWAGFCGSPPVAGEIVSIQARRS